MHRRTFLGLVGAAPLALFASRAQAADVPWLDEVQKPPAERPPDAGLSPLLVRADGTKITTREQWETERERIRKAWIEFLGPMPAERPGIEWKVLREDRIDGCLRQLVRYDSEPGLPVEAYILRPTGRSAQTPIAQKKAGLVALHQTSQDHIDEIAGVAGPESQHLGLRLCRRGFVVVCPRCFLWQNAANYQEAVANFRARHPQTLGMHKMLWDASRGVDVLHALKDEVDPQRIGATGHSLGSKETLYLAAFDERIRAAVASEGGIGFSFTNWDAPWYLGPGIKEPGFTLNHHQVLALIAPRPFLILAGESGKGAADGDRTWPYVEAALSVYSLYGSPPRLGLYNHREGHTISDNTFERLAEWLEAYLSL